MLGSLTKERLIVRVTVIVLLEMPHRCGGKGKTHVGGLKAGKKVMTFITNRELCCAFRETHAFSRVSVTRYKCHTVVATFNRQPRP